MRQRGLDPASVQGTGPNGRIVEADVVRTSSRQVPHEPSLAASSFFWVRAVADLTTLTSLQKQVAGQIQQLCGTPLRLGDLVLRATALALADPPAAKAADRREIHIALDAPLSTGRATIVFQQADRLGLVELVRFRAEHEAAFGSGKVPVQNLQDVSATLLDLSDHPVDECVPAIAAGSTVQLGLGRVAARPHVVDGQLAVRQTAVLTLATEGRVMGQEAAASLLGRIVELLERPFVLVCDRPPW